MCNKGQGILVFADKKHWAIGQILDKRERKGPLCGLLRLSSTQWGSPLP